MAAVYGSMTTMGLESMIRLGLRPKLRFRPSVPGSGATITILPTQTILADFISNTDWTANLAPTTNLRPLKGTRPVVYGVEVEWLDAAGNFVKLDYLDVELTVPPEGGNFADLVVLPPAPREFTRLSDSEYMDLVLSGTVDPDVMYVTYPDPLPVLTSDTWSGGDTASLSGRLSDAALGGASLPWSDTPGFSVSGSRLTGVSAGLTKIVMDYPDYEISVRVDAFPTTGMTVAARSLATTTPQDGNGFHVFVDSAGAAFARRSATGTGWVSETTPSAQLSLGDSIRVRVFKQTIQWVVNDFVIRELSGVATVESNSILLGSFGSGGQFGPATAVTVNSLR